MRMFNFLIRLIPLISIARSENCAANEPCVCQTLPKDILARRLDTTGRDEYVFNVYRDILVNDTELQSADNISGIIECSNRSLQSIPKFRLLGYSNQPTVDCLDLSQNQLDVVSESLFYGLVLRCIDLSFNNINRLSRNAFKGLLNTLTVLKLNSNRITSEVAFPAYYISKLNRIQALDLSSNRFEIHLFI